MSPFGRCHCPYSWLLTALAYRNILLLIFRWKVHIIFRYKMKYDLERSLLCQTLTILYLHRITVLKSRVRWIVLSPVQDVWAGCSGARGNPRTATRQCLLKRTPLFQNCVMPLLSSFSMYFHGRGGMYDIGRVLHNIDTPNFPENPVSFKWKVVVLITYAGCQ